MKVAAYQAPLVATGAQGLSLTLDLISIRVRSCEAEGVDILCCPEAILGGLADYAEDPIQFAMRVEDGELDAMLAPLASDTVTTIVGFTERGDGGLLYNSAAVYQRGSVSGVYRKLHPAINRSVYEPGLESPVFEVGKLTFGIVICNDSNFAEPARRMAEQGATAIFVPSNNGMPANRGGVELVEAARNIDIRMAVENKIWVIRADVAGEAGELVSYGSSRIVDPYGSVVQAARQLSEDLIIAEISRAPLDHPPPPL